MNSSNATVPLASDFSELARFSLVEVNSAPELPDDPKVPFRRLEELPKELGVLLASVGVFGIVMPGIAGVPALIAGGLVLWPKTFGKVEGWFSRRYPIAYRKSMHQVVRFLDDLDRRYPRSESDRI